MITYEQAVSEPEIPTLTSAVRSRVIHTCEERMVARETVRVLRAATTNDDDRKAPQ